MKMKLNLTEKDVRSFVILGVIALICIIYISFRERNDINYTLPSFPELSTDEFSRLEILPPDGNPLSMEKNGGQWTISDNYPADPTVVNRMLDFLEKPTPIDLVSESGKYGRYELDEEGRYTLRGYSKEDLLREVFFGKTSSSNKYNYVLFPGYRSVYTVRGTMVETLSRDPESFRDKLVLELNRSTVTSIKYTADDQADIVLTKNEEETWTDSNEVVWATEKVNEILGRFTSLRATDFPENPPDEKNAAAVLTLTGETAVTIRFFNQDDRGYPVIASSYPFPVIISSYVGDSILEGFSSESSEE